MKAILIGGPRHLDEFEIGDCHSLPSYWFVPVPPAFGTVQEQFSPFYQPPPLHQTHCYRLHIKLHEFGAEIIAGRAIYVSEDE
jgi:hypothetical protein